jgi:hypothetical protein
MPVPIAISIVFVGSYALSLPVWVAFAILAAAFAWQYVEDSHWRGGR